MRTSIRSIPSAVRYSAIYPMFLSLVRPDRISSPITSTAAVTICFDCGEFSMAMHDPIAGAAGGYGAPIPCHCELWVSKSSNLIGERAMSQRITNLLIIALLIVVGIYIAQPRIDRWLYSASTPRTVAPRGNLSDLERSTIELFERVSPSVVQVVGRAAGGESSPAEGEGVAAQTGTGFLWDGAGHIVTNNHVV